MRPLQSLLDVSCAGETNARLVVPDGISEVRQYAGSWIVERLIHHVPGEDLPLVMAHDSVDVILQQRRHLGGGCSLRVWAKPRGKLRIPAEIVPAHLHMVGLRKRHQLIGGFE